MNTSPVASTHEPAEVQARTRLLLHAGVAAGPTLVVIWLAQGLLRNGYDFTRHPMSLLALGDDGWIQIANFVWPAPLGCAEPCRTGEEERGLRVSSP